jgi:hypothetical protein
MKCRFFSISISLLMMGVSSIAFSVSSRAQTATPSPSAAGQNRNAQNGFLQFNYGPGRTADTLRMIDIQNREMEAGDRSRQTLQDNLSSNRSRAQDMVNMLKDEEMQKALVKVTARGKQVLTENPEIKSPMGIIAGAMSLWYGRSIKLIKGETFKLSSRLEIRGRNGEFSMESPLFNGTLHYGVGDLNISVNRRISSIDTSAELYYNMNNQSFNTQLRHSLAPNLDLTFGASQIPDTRQTDGRAGFEYRLDF